MAGYGVNPSQPVGIASSSTSFRNYHAVPARLIWRSSQHTSKSVANIPKPSIFPKLEAINTLLPYDRDASAMEVLEYPLTPYLMKIRFEQPLNTCIIQ